MTDTYELPEPAAWLVASCLQWLTDPARTASAYTYPEMTRRNPDDGLERAPIFTADQVRTAIQRERDLLQEALKELESMMHKMDEYSYQATLQDKPGFQALRVIEKLRAIRKG